MTARPVHPWWQFVDANGVPRAGAKLYTYDSGTSTLKATYSDAAQTVPNANPIIADSSGMFPDVFVAPGQYKFVLTDANGAIIRTSDPIGDVDLLRITSRTITSADTIIANDNGRTILCNGSFTLALAGAATCGDGFRFYVRNIGTSTVTLDPDGSELIDGAATLALLPGFYATIYCTGSAWLVSDFPLEMRVGGETIETAKANVDFTPLYEGLLYRVALTATLTSASTIGLRTSTTGGASFDTGGSDYGTGAIYNIASGDAVSSAGSTAQIFLGPTMDDGLVIATSALFYPGSSTSRATLFMAAQSGIDNTPIVSASHYAGMRLADGAVNAIRIFTGSTFATGSVFSLYAIRR